MKKTTLTLGAMTALVVSAHATDLNGSDWNFAYQGHYSLVAADVSGLGLTSIAGAALTAQLALLNGTISTSKAMTLTQTAPNALTTGHLDFDAHGGTLLLPAVKSFLYNLLDANDGVYSGQISGSTLSLSRTPLVGVQASGLGVLDTRVAGLGVVIDLRAAVPTNALTGTIDGTDAGTSLPYGLRANHVTGTEGLMSTASLQARATVYALGLHGITATSTDYVNVGAIRTTADSWSLSRSPQAVPEPATVAALGVGILGALRRRRKA